MINWMHVTSDGPALLSIGPLKGAGLSAVEHLHAPLFYLVVLIRFYNRPSPRASPASLCSVLSRMKADLCPSHAG